MQLVELILHNAAVQAMVIGGLVWVVMEVAKAVGLADATDLKKRVTAVVTGTVLAVCTELVRMATDGDGFAIWNVVTSLVVVFAGATTIHTLTPSAGQSTP